MMNWKIAMQIISEQNIYNRENVENVVCFDFDGVIHLSPHLAGGSWGGIDVIDGPPIPGAKEAIDKLSKRFIIVIFSARCRTGAGRMAIRKWMLKNGIFFNEVARYKPAARIYVDDRAVVFDGSYRRLMRSIKGFVPWTKKYPSLAKKILRGGIAGDTLTKTF